MHIYIYICIYIYTYIHTYHLSAQTAPPALARGAGRGFPGDAEHDFASARARPTPVSPPTSEARPTPFVARADGRPWLDWRKN